MSRSNHQELDKITLTNWVDQALEQSLSTKNIKSKFRSTSIWPINPKVMDSNTKPLKVYTTIININNVRSEENYTTKEETVNNQQWGEDFATAKLLHISEQFNIKHLKIYLPIG